MFISNAGGRTITELAAEVKSTHKKMRTTKDPAERAILKVRRDRLAAELRREANKINFLTR